MPLRNFDAPILALDGTPAKEHKRNLDGSFAFDKDNKPIFVDVLIRTAVAGAIKQDYKGDDALSFKEKEERYELAKKIMKGGNVEISTEEQKAIMVLCAKGLPIEVVGQIRPSLETDVSEK